MPRKYTDDSITVPSGLLLFDGLELANSTEVSIEVAVETQEQYGGDGPSLDLLAAWGTKVARSGKASSINVTDDAIDLFALGSHKVVAPTAATETAQPINGGVPLKAGRRYWLGVTTGRPTGAKRLTAVSIHSGTGEAEVDYEEGATKDYVLDPDNGAWIYIPADSDCVGVVCHSTHTVAAYDWVQHETDDDGARIGELRFLSDNAAGPNRDIMIPRCLLAPKGDWALKSAQRDKVVELGWELRIMRPLTSTLASLYVDGAPYAR